MDDDDGVSVTSPLELSEPDTQFIPQENDDEELWEVIEITAEKGRQYKVKWAGVDPKTRKPWPQSWVPKHDCTDDLVKTWKTRQAKKKKEKERQKGKRASTSSTKNPRLSTTSYITSTRGGSTASSSTAKNLKSDANTPIPIVTSSSNGKRSYSPAISVSNNVFERDQSMLEPPPRKKRKVEVEPIVVVDEAEEESEQESQLIKKVGESLKRTIDKVGKSKKKADNQGKEKLTYKEGEPNDTEEEIAKQDLRRAKELEDRKAKAISKKKSQLRRIGNGLSTTNSVTSDHGRTPVAKNGTLKAAAAIKRSRATPRVDPTPSPDRELSPLHRPPFIPKATHVLDEDDNDDDVNPPPLIRSHSTPSLSLPLPTDSPDNIVLMPTKPHQPMSPSSDLLLRLSPAAIARLQEFDEMIEASEESISPLQRDDVNDMMTTSGDVPQSLAIPIPIAPPPIISVRTLGNDLLPFSHHNILESVDDMSHLEGRTSPPPQDRHIRPANGRFSRDGSFRQGVVPETETESSTNNTQSQTQPLPVLPLIIEPPVVAISDMSTPARASLIRGMKPKTPVSASGSKLSLIDEVDAFDRHHDYLDEGAPLAVPSTYIETPDRTSEKILRPIPVLSPSTFIPHLPPTSSISAHDGEEVEAEEFMSSIEQFSSPEKGSSRSSPDLERRRRDKGKQRATEHQVQDISITEDEDSVMERGQKMAASARQERIRQERGLIGEASSQKKTLVDLLKASRRNQKPRDKTHFAVFLRRDKGGSSELAIQEPDEIDSHRVEVGGSGTPVIGFVSKETFSAGEVDEGDLDAEGSLDIPYLMLRQEEEESTQDLMEDLGRGMKAVDVEMGWDFTGRESQGRSEMGEPAFGGEKTTQVEDDHIIVDRADPPSAPLIPHPLISQPSQAEFLDADKPQRENSPDIFLTGTPAEQIHSRSRSSSKSTRSGPLANKTMKPVEEESQVVLPPTASIRQPTPGPSPEVIQIDKPEHLAAMTLLSAKSQEIANLDRLLLAEQAKTAALSKEVESLRNALLSAGNEIRPREADLELQIVEVQKKLTEEKSGWDAECAKLTTSIESLTRERASAQTDRDFFREQYAKASGFVTSVREENVELEARTRIAEEQATSGVAMIKATFEKRVEKLEEDARHWRNIAVFIVDKDQRTNDDIRRRAAEEPQLRARCEELEEQLDFLQDRLSSLEDNLSDKDQVIERLETEAESWKKETTRLNIELNETQTKLERSNKREGSPSDYEMVYRCQWRPEGTNNPCEGLFRNIEDLQNHLYTGGHLHD